MTNYTGFEVYIIGFILSLIFGVKAQRVRDNTLIKHKWSDYTPMLLSCLSLWLIAAFRDKVGLDWDNYETQFYNIQSTSELGGYFEPGFGLLNLIVYKCGGDFHWLIAVSSIITGLLFWNCLYKNSCCIWLAIIGVISINLYAMSFSVIRQFISISVVLLSVPYIKTRNLKKYLIVITCAFLLHYTALVFAPMYFIYDNSDKLVTKKNLILLSILIIILTYIDIFLREVFILSGGLRETYTAYQESDTNKSIKEVLMYLPILAYIIAYYRRLINTDRTNKVFITMFFMWIMFKLIGIYEPSLSRVQYYFAISGPILLSYAPKIAKSSTERICLIIAIIFFYAWDFSHILQYQWEDFLPYKSIF